MNFAKQPSNRQSGYSGEAIRVVKVQNRNTLNDFIRLPWSIYVNDPMWIPPLLLERRMHFSPNNPYFKHAKFCSWVAYQDGKPVGRISAQIDRLHIDRYQDATGFFGMLEDNMRMRAIIESIGGRVYKTYRIYSKQLTEGNS